jgi:hypothetical protein
VSCGRGEEHEDIGTKAALLKNNNECDITK